jgi:hypothetical protein
MAVESGAHHGYAPDPGKPLDYTLTDLLLTRGSGPVDDIRFARQISRGVPDQGLQGYVVNKLRHLALTERGEVKVSTCRLLWIYTVDLVDRRIRESAGTAIREAACRCSIRSDGNVDCR